MLVPGRLRRDNLQFKASMNYTATMLQETNTNGLQERNQGPFPHAHLPVTKLYPTHSPVLLKPMPIKPKTHKLCEGHDRTRNQHNQVFKDLSQVVATFNPNTQESEAGGSF